MSMVRSLAAAGVFAPPVAVEKNIIFEVLMGSHAFGTSNDESDYDIYGVYCPGVESICAVETFKQLDVLVDDGDGGKLAHDFKFYSIVSYFQECLKGKSQALEMLFTVDGNILYQSSAARLLRDNRDLFLTKVAAVEFRRFARDQLHGMEHKLFRDGKRQGYIDKFGYDVKAGYHGLRLLLEVWRMLCSGGLELQIAPDLLMRVRSGVYDEATVLEQCRSIDIRIEDALDNSRVNEKPDMLKIQQLLYDCLETHFGSLRGLPELPQL